jgi:hypothetical protein
MKAEAPGPQNNSGKNSVAKMSLHDAGKETKRLKPFLA